MGVLKAGKRMMGLAVIAGFLLSLSREQPITASIVVLPLGRVTQSKVKAVAKRLSETFHVTVSIAPREPLPKSTYYAPRNRYRADKLLTWLGKRYSESYVMGITSSDISTTKGTFRDWGVFGLGQMPGRAAVVSDFRLSRKGSVPAKERLLRVATHEFGHNLGLPHCKNQCIMSDAEGSIKSVDATNQFCPECRKTLSRREALR